MADTIFGGEKGQVLSANIEGEGLIVAFICLWLHFWGPLAYSHKIDSMEEEF